MDGIEFSVSGTPRPQGSKRLVRGRMIESSRGLAEWRRALSMSALAARQKAGHCMPPRDAPVIVMCEFRLCRSVTAKPDIDKLVRAVLDAIVEAGLLADDSQVADLAAWKVRVASKDREGASVEVLYEQYEQG